MTLFFHLPDPGACSGPSVQKHTRGDGYVQRRMVRIADCLVALTAPPLTDDELAEKASKVAAVRFADEFKRRDLLS